MIDLVAYFCLDMQGKFAFWSICSYNGIGVETSQN